MARRIPSHFQAIGAAMAADAAERRIEALRMSSFERMREGLRMAAVMPSDAASEAELDRRALGQGELVKRWRSRHPV